MLTNQHRFVARMIHCTERVTYKQHMCGVCHALGDDYGMISRVMTNHEIILLNMLTEAQCETLPDVVMRRCPLNPRQHVRTNQTVSSRFAAAIGVMLVNTSVEDDLRDGKGLQLPTRLLKTMIGRLAQTAHETLNTLQFDTKRLIALQDEQSLAEANHSNPLVPSMQSSAAIFAMTGTLANQPTNQPALATLGANYGAYLYLLDAVKDYAEDYHNGDYNPLADFTHVTDRTLTLTQQGVDWLKIQFDEILTNIQTQLAHIQLYHYQETLHTMLTQPIQRMIDRLHSVTDGIYYAQITRRDIWDSLLLMSDDKPKGDSVDDFFSDEDDADHPTKQKGKKPKKDRNRDNCCRESSEDAAWSFLWCDGDVFNCIDSDCDGTPDCIDSDIGSCGGGDGLDCGGCDGLDCGGADCST